MKPEFTLIGLIITHHRAYGRGVLRIKEFAELRPQWILMPVAPEPSAVRALGRMKPAGVIAHLFKESTANAVVNLCKPFVNVASMMREPVVPRVGNDDLACGRVAAEHLLDRGFRSFGFVGVPDHYYSATRERGFRETIEAAGCRVESYHEPRHAPLDLVGRMWLRHRAVDRWLSSLAHPVGLLAADDTLGFQLTEVCRQAGLHVPEDISIVGVGNDELLCNLARPAFSSVPFSARRVGLEAASLLDKLLRGGPAPREPILLPPGPVVPRRSSERLAIADRDVAQAVRLIRDQRHQQLSVDDVLTGIPVSRRYLERRFRAVLGRSILDEIRQAHVERACRLLTETEFPIETVAESSGFSGAKHLWVVFRQLLGQTPNEFRRATRDPSNKSATHGDPS